MNRFLFGILILLVTLGTGCSGSAGLQQPENPLTPAEQTVSDLIKQPGVHVIHFWAPWCLNSISEIRMGWYEVIGAYAERDDVTFTFVTIWNDGKSGRELLDQYAIPSSVTELMLADFGPSDDPDQRRRSFLGNPLTWSPSTWIFNQEGNLAFMNNYGEISPESLREMIDSADSPWEHD